MPPCLLHHTTLQSCVLNWCQYSWNKKGRRKKRTGQTTRDVRGGRTQRSESPPALPGSQTNHRRAAAGRRRLLRAYGYATPMRTAMPLLPSASLTPHTPRKGAGNASCVIYTTPTTTITPTTTTYLPIAGPSGAVKTGPTYLLRGPARSRMTIIIGTSTHGHMEHMEGGRVSCGTGSCGFPATI